MISNIFRNNFLLYTFLLCAISLSACLIWLNIIVWKTEHQLHLEIQTSISLRTTLDSLEKNIKNHRPDSSKVNSEIITTSKKSTSKLIHNEISNKKAFKSNSEDNIVQKKERLEFSPLNFKSHLKAPVEIDEYLNILYVSISLFESNYNSIKFNVKKQDLTNDQNIAEDYPFKLFSYKKNADSTFQIILEEVRLTNLIQEDPVNYNKQMTIKISGKINSEMIDCFFLWKDITYRQRSAKIKLLAQKVN